MTLTPEKNSKQVTANPDPSSSTESHLAIDRNAIAGSENSLGAESVRDGRPTTKSGVVEAIDEM